MIGAAFVAIVALYFIWELFKTGNVDLPGTCSFMSGCCGGNCGMSCEITNDPNTWPSGDRIWLICHAIATAEGANIAGSNPDRLNNPGDISDHALQYGSELHSGSLITRFPDKLTGWNALHDKISNIAAGNSKVYSATDSWETFASKYAGNSSAWLANVTQILGVDPNSTLADYVNA
jgi:hypothetical protein